MKKIILSTVLVIGLSFTSFAQVGVGTTSPEVSAALDMSSVTMGFLPPRMTNIQMDAISSPAEGLMIYCTDCTPKGLYAYDGVNYLSLLLGGENTAGTDTSTIVTELQSTATGKIWMDRNLGATQQSASTTDAASYGDLYQWGRAKDGHESRTSLTTTTLATSGNPGHGKFIKGSNWTDFTEEDDLWQSGLNDPCPSGYRLPTEVEFDAEITGGIGSSTDALNVLKLSLPGYRQNANASLNQVNGSGYYWSSTVNATVTNESKILHIYGSTVNIQSFKRAYGFSVRCTQD